MAVRTPLILDGSNNLIEMTTAQINAVKDRCRYLYGSDPSVTLSRVSSEGNLGNLSDTRKQAGAVSTSISALPDEATTAEPSTVTVQRAHISESRVNTSASVDTNSVAFPVYQTSGNIQAMTLTDVYDTFIYPAIDTITGAAGQPGTYYIHTSTTLSGYSSVSTSIVYADTRANTGAYTAGGIGETLDQPTTITNYYLLAANNISAPSMAQMLFIRNTDKNLEQYTQAEMDAWLKNSMRHAASEITGSKISYNLNGSGINLGSGMTDTILNGSGNYQTRYVGLDDYRAQEFPNGSAVTAATHRLKINQV
jgi:hypothetical protein